MSKTIKAKFAGTCDVCGVSFPAGETVSYNGRASHVACVEAEIARERAEESAYIEACRVYQADYKAGRLITSTFTAGAKPEIMVRKAPDYKAAHAEATAFVCSVIAAGGKARLVAHVKNGKRYVGRAVVTGWGGLYTSQTHEGWAFRVEVAS